MEQEQKWWNKSFLDIFRTEKLNPAQEIIAVSEGDVVATDSLITFAQAFDKLESVNRGVSMVVGACASLDFDIKDKNLEGIANGVKQKTLTNLLNFKVNPFQSVQEF